MPLQVPLIVNDRAKTAVAAEADGLHIGRKVGDPATRAAIGPDRLVGLSIEAEDQFPVVDPACVDHLGVGPVRGTPTKPDAAPAIGMNGLAAICRAAPLPALVTGGIGPDEVAPAIRAGAAGNAVVSVLCAAPDRAAAARELRRRIEAARRDLSERSLP